MAALKGRFGASRLHDVLVRALDPGMLALPPLNHKSGLRFRTAAALDTWERRTGFPQLEGRVLC
jgi:hypothetical protein